MYTPPQRNFDGTAWKQAARAALNANLEHNADSSLWADRATFRAKRALKLLGADKFDAVMARFSDAWFEARTWQAQAEAFLRLSTRYDWYPESGIGELVEAFGEPDVPATVQ